MARIAEQLRAAPEFAAQVRRTERRPARAIGRLRDFLAAYRDTRGRWLLGAKSVRFPSGTYWLARFAPVTLVLLGAP